MSARAAIAEHLATVLPAFISVIDHDASPTIHRTTVMVWVEKIEHATSNLGHWHWTIAVLVMVPKQSGGDTDLEDALDEVLEALDLWDYPVVWQSADRSIYDDTYPSFKITADLYTRRAYPDDETPVPDPTPEEE